MREWKNESKDVHVLDVEGLRVRIHRIKPSYGWFLQCMELRIFNQYLDTDDLEKAKKQGMKMIAERFKELEDIKNSLFPSRIKSTGLKDCNGKEICTGHIMKLKLDDGIVRKFKVKEKTVVREVVNLPDFEVGTSKVVITGIVFEWNGYDLFPCVDENGVFDNEKMKIIGVHNE